MSPPSETDERNSKSVDHRQLAFDLDLPPVARDEAGVPELVFKNTLAPEDRPHENRRTLEVSMWWREAILEVKHLSKSQPVRVGSEVDSDFHLASELLPDEAFELIDIDGEDAVIQWRDGMTAEVRDESGVVANESELTSLDRRSSIGDAHYGYRLQLHDRVAVQIDDVTFVVQYVAPAQPVPLGLSHRVDTAFVRAWSASFLGHAVAVLALLFLVPVVEPDLDQELFDNPDRFARLLLSDIERPPPTRTERSRGSRRGGRAKGEEGKFGKAPPNQSDAAPSVAGAPVVDPDRLERDRKVARQAGILKALEGANSDAVSNVFGPGGLGTGVNKAMGGLRGTRTGDAGGNGGLGVRGTKTGGGGKSVGIGGLGDGAGRGSGGGGDLELSGQGRKSIRVTPGRTTTKGCLSAAVVGRVISRSNSRIKFCYEKGLQADPDLAGKVTMRFTVGPIGSVLQASVAQSTLAAPSVEQCISRVVQQMRFPPCTGGGTAEVTYPWLFKPSGG
ncbi:MAG: AgmX/PglI C-terminal domain-containing protein [Myxococcota bacterium]